MELFDDELLVICQEDNLMYIPVDAKFMKKVGFDLKRKKLWHFTDALGITQLKKLENISKQKSSEESATVLSAFSITNDNLKILCRYRWIYVK